MVTSELPAATRVVVSSRSNPKVTKTIGLYLKRKPAQRSAVSIDRKNPIVHGGEIGVVVVLVFVVVFHLRAVDAYVDDSVLKHIIPDLHITLNCPICPLYKYNT